MGLNTDMDTELIYSLLLDKALNEFLDTITITRYGHFTPTYTYVYKYIQLQLYRMQNLIVARYCRHPLQSLVHVHLHL